MSLMDEERNLAYDERVIQFNKNGYRGFKEKNSNQKFESIQITVADAKDHTITETGDTREEVIKKLIDKIDQYLD